MLFVYSLFELRTLTLIQEVQIISLVIDKFVCDITV